MGEALAGTGKPLVIASGALGLVKGKPCDGDGDVEHNTFLASRLLSADAVYKMAKENNVWGTVTPVCRPLFMDLKTRALLQC